MLFNSYIFIFAFLPLCMLGYYLLRSRLPLAAKLWLIGFSLWFYGYFNLSYLFIMIGSILGNYLIYLGMRRLQNREKTLYVVGIIANLALLFYFKYFDFFLTNVNTIFKTDIPLKGILLPLGISFFTFQQISFLTDVHRGDIEQVGFIDYALFVSFFPQLIAGPIVEAGEMLPQFAAIGEAKVDGQKMAKGLMVFVLGMAKKVLLADTFGVAVDAVYGSLTTASATDTLLAILFYSLQLYFDFSGYCDMAIGIGQLLGIDIAVNFNSPYKSANIYEFWKRWHITLSRFFTKNIYIPLGGNRKGTARMYANLFIVFFLSGLWHGAGYTYILWGCMHGILYIICRAVSRARDGKPLMPRPVGVLLTFIFLNLTWLIFRAGSLADVWQAFSNLINGAYVLPSEPVYSAFNLPEFWYALKVLHLTDRSCGNYICMLGFTIVSLLMVFAMPNVHEISSKLKYRVWDGIWLAILFVWCVVSLSGVSTFLYFNF